MSRKATDAVKILYKEMKRTQSDSVHFTMNEIFHNDKASAVISVLNGKKPPHLILNELREWAEKKNDRELLDKIESLECDLSFLEEGNISL